MTTIPPATDEDRERDLEFFYDAYAYAKLIPVETVKSLIRRCHEAERRAATAEHVCGYDRATLNTILEEHAEESRKQYQRAEQAERQFAARQWQPIATAPKDGTWILLATPSGVQCGFWGPTYFGRDHAWVQYSHRSECEQIDGASGGRTMTQQHLDACALFELQEKLDKGLLVSWQIVYGPSWPYRMRKQPRCPESESPSTYRVRIRLNDGSPEKEFEAPQFSEAVIGALRQAGLLGNKSRA